MSVLDRATLEGSPLADLHAIASELSIDGYRRLRRDDLVDAILAKQGGSAGVPDRAESEIEQLEAAAAGDLTETVVEELSIHDDNQPRRRRGRRGGRSRSSAREQVPTRQEEAAEEREDEPPDQREEREPEDAIVEGVVELLSNGSGFLRVAPPEPSDEDVYISAAQVKRCELVSGDRISGPRRAPRRSERFASLVRIDTINGRPAEEVADSARFEDLPAAFPSERFRLGTDDPTIKAIEWLTPIGKGSRVTIVGGARAGKTEALRRLVGVLASDQGLQLSLVLAGVRPEELSDWPVEPAAAISLGGSTDAQGQTVERVVDQARRLAARGADAVVLIDSIDGIDPHVARKLLAAARNVVGAGSLTVIATAREPLGGETTVIALDVLLTSTGRFPALDLIASGTIGAELLVGEAGAEAITRARAEALERTGAEAITRARAEALEQTGAEAITRARAEALERLQ